MQSRSILRFCCVLFFEKKQSIYSINRKLLCCALIDTHANSSSTIAICNSIWNLRRYMKYDILSRAKIRRNFDELQQQQQSLLVPSKLGQARVETHQEPQVTVQALSVYIMNSIDFNINSKKLISTGSFCAVTRFYHKQKLK